MFRNPEGRAAVFNFQVLFPTFLLVAKSVARGYREISDILLSDDKINAETMEYIFYDSIMHLLVGAFTALVAASFYTDGRSSLTWQFYCLYNRIRRFLPEERWMLNAVAISMACIHFLMLDAGQGSRSTILQWV